MENKELARIKQAIKNIKTNGKPLRQRQIMEDLGYVRESSISDILHGRSGLTDKFKKAFCSMYGIRTEWLETGQGPMFKSALVPDPELVVNEDAPTEPAEAYKEKYLAVLADYHEDRKLLRQTASKSLDTMERVTASLTEMERNQQVFYSQLRATQAILVGVAAKVEKTTPEDIAFRMDKIAGQVVPQQTKSKKGGVGNLSTAFNT